MPRFLRGLDEIGVEILAVGISSLIFFVLASTAVNSTAAHRLDGLPVVGPIVAGFRAATNKIVS